MKKIKPNKIGRKNVFFRKTFIVAEISANHNNSLSRAKKLILSAKNSGADAVKIQSYTPESLTLNCKKKDFVIKNLPKNSPWKKYKTHYDLYRKTFTPISWHKELFKFARKNKIEIFSSPFDLESVEVLEKLGCVAYKIASPEITHIPLIKKVAKTKKPIILSTGVASLEDISLAVKTIKKFKNNKIIILKCETAYPADIKNSNLSSLKFLSKKFNTLVGYSDHTKSTTSAIISVLMGGCLIEKHFNLEDNLKTPDSFFSSKFSDFRKMVKEIRQVEKLENNKKYHLSKNSIKNSVSKRSIYISKNVFKNEKINFNNIRIVRPGYGLHPKYFEKIIGKKFNKKKNYGDRLSLKDITF